MVPRYAFITWLALHNRLSTRSRQVKFNTSIPVSCLFCDIAETRDHLYFACPYTSRVWSDVITRVGKAGFIPNDWALLVPWAEHALQRSTSINILSKIALQACIYFIWLERNSRVYGKGSKTEVEPVNLFSSI